MEGIELVVYSAQWCGPCKAMYPVLRELEAVGVTVTKIDIDQNQALARQEKVGAVPTLVLRKDGVDRVRMVGARDKNTLLRQIQSIQQSDDNL